MLWLSLNHEWMIAHFNPLNTFVFLFLFSLFFFLCRTNYYFSIRNDGAENLFSSLIFFFREIKGIGKWANGNHNVLNKIDVRSWCAQVQFERNKINTHNIEIILNVYAWCLLTTVHRISSAYLSYTRPWFAYAFRNSELRTGKMRIVKNEQWTTNNTSWRWLKQTNERALELAPRQSSIECMHYTKHTQQTQIQSDTLAASPLNNRNGR